MRIHPFIFNWKGQTDNVLHSVHQLEEINYRPVVINSDEEYARDGWVNIGDAAFFTRQLLTAFSLFEGDVFFHIQGDAGYHDWASIISRAKVTFEDYQWGLYAPNVDYTYHTGERVDILSLQCNDPFLRIVSCTDCTCWFIHADIVKAFTDLNINLSQNKYGWGLDVLFSAISFSMERPVLRDYSHTIHHPQGTGYAHEPATAEMHRLFRSLPSYLQQIVTFIRDDKEQLAPLLMKSSA